MFYLHVIISFFKIQIVSHFSYREAMVGCWGLNTCFHLILWHSNENVKNYISHLKNALIQHSWLTNYSFSIVIKKCNVRKNINFKTCENTGFSQSPRINEYINFKNFILFQIIDFISYLLICYWFLIKSTNWMFSLFN